MTDLMVQGQDFTAQEIVAVMEKMSEVVGKARIIALKGTTPADWTDQGGKPYLTISGSNKVKNIFKVSITDCVQNTIHLEDELGKYYVVTFQATFTWSLGSTTMTGTCSSRDKFFGKDKEMSQVDFTNVLKKAETNCYGRGIKALLGIGNIEWDELEKITGWGRGQATKVEYRDKSVVSDKMKEMQVELRGLVLAQSNNDVEAAKGLLELMTEFTTKEGNKVSGKREIDKLTEKQLEMCLRKLKEGK